MPENSFPDNVRIFSTCPMGLLDTPHTAVRRLREVARWSEEAGCEGILVYTDNGQLDPWLVSAVITESTSALCPLVAIQPVYMHPYSVAKMVASFALLHRRRVHLNLVAGGFKNDLLALGDPTPHDERYARLIEYASIVQRLLRPGEPTSLKGRYYSVSNLKLVPPLPADLAGDVLVSGTSEAGRQAAKDLGAIAVEYPKPAWEYDVASGTDDSRRGIRIGIIARPDDGAAWKAAVAYFPNDDRKGELANQLANKVSDSQWRHELAQRVDNPSDLTPYWMVPFRNYKSMCPYLVGSYDQVAEEIGRYIDAGYRTFILEVPDNREEWLHAGAVFERARRAVPA